MLMLQAGDATIGGLSIRSEMEAIRGALGVCPQDNVLYDLLTAREHLELFTALRSGGGGGRAAVDSLLARASLAAEARKSCSSVAVNDGVFPRQVGLADKASTLASRLSGEITRDYPRLPSRLSGGGAEARALPLL